MAEIESEAKTPGAEFRIAAAGPAVSLVLGLVFYGAGFALANVFGTSLMATMLGWLGIVNGILALFNLIPAAPLDGGRILTAGLWAWTGNPHRARARAATVGQVFGALLLGVGTLALLNGGSFWLLVLGWFIMSGAAAERRRAELFEVAAHVSVGEVMAPLASPTDGAVTAVGLATMAGANSHVAFPVRGPDGVIVGLVPGSTLRTLHPKRHAGVRATELVVPWTDFVSARTDEPLEDIVDRLRTADAHHVLVYDNWGHQAGYLGLPELTRAGRLVPT